MSRKLLSLLIFFLLSGCIDTKKENDDKESSNTQENSSPTNLEVGEEWVLVPKNAGNMGLEAFYVMKYEAKAMRVSDKSIDSTGISIDKSLYKPVSFNNNAPWVNINSTDAQAECESLGDGHHLLTNAQWMAIAREIELQNKNWTGGSIGSGCLFRGNSGEETTGDGTDVLDSCGYNAVSDPDQGSVRDKRAQLTLSNNSIIFDFSGNVSEWVDWDGEQDGFQSGPSTCNTGWEELDDFSCAEMSDNFYNSQNGTYDSAQGVGQIYGGVVYNGDNTGATSRGGSFTSEAVAGIYSTYMHAFQTFTHVRLGFRCAYRD